MNLFEHLAAAHRLQPDAICLSSVSDHQQTDWSWAELDATSARIANWIVNLGLPPQARVLVQVEKSAAALCLYLACLRSGMIYVPLNTAYQQTELAYFIADAQASLIVGRPQDLALLRELANAHACPHVYGLAQDYHGADSLLDACASSASEHQTATIAAGQLAAILYTSGTTGRSKGAMLSHHNLASNALTLHQVWHWQKQDVLLHCLPLFHVHGLFVACHGALLAGARMIMLEKFELAPVLHYLPQTTVFMGVPTYYVRLLASPEFSQTHCRNVRLFISGSAPLLLDTFTEFQHRTSHCILERYGMSETTMLTSNPYQGLRQPGSVGPALPGVSIRIQNEVNQTCDAGVIGAIQVKGPNVFAGYWQMPEKTASEFTADGYFITGDLGYFDQAGYLHIVGRSKDLIITGGYNVYPKEIEGYLDELTGVAESAVIGLPHPDFGEAVCAVVVPRANANLNEQDLIEQLKSKIANFKVPKKIVFMAELPRNTMGKVQKNSLRQQLSLT